MDVNAAPYNLSFTAASLRPELARIVAEHFLAVRDWEKTKEHILSTNALQCRSASSAVRLERELRQRLGDIDVTSNSSFWLKPLRKIGRRWRGLRPASASALLLNSPPKR